MAILIARTPERAALKMSFIASGQVLERRATLYIEYAAVMYANPSSDGDFSAHLTIGSDGSDLAKARSSALCMCGQRR